MVMIDKDGIFKYINPNLENCSVMIYVMSLTEKPGLGRHIRSYYRHHVISTWINDLESFSSGEKRSETFTVTCKGGGKDNQFYPCPIRNRREFDGL